MLVADTTNSVAITTQYVFLIIGSVMVIRIAPMNLTKLVVVSFTFLNYGVIINWEGGGIFLNPKQI